MSLVFSCSSVKNNSLLLNFYSQRCELPVSVKQRLLLISTTRCPSRTNESCGSRSWYWICHYTLCGLEEPATGVNWSSFESQLGQIDKWRMYFNNSSVDSAHLGAPLSALLCLGKTCLGICVRYDRNVRHVLKCFPCVTWWCCYSGRKIWI